jgi:hypothetical protein
MMTGELSAQDFEKREMLFRPEKRDDGNEVLWYKIINHQSSIINNP